MRADHFLRTYLRTTTSYQSINFTLDTLYYLTYHTARSGTKWNGVEQLDKTPEEGMGRREGEEG